MSPGSAEHVRVLYVNHTSLVSGAERSLLTLLAAVDRDRVAGLACPAGPLAQRARSLGVDVHEIAGTTGSFQLHPARTAIAIAELARTGMQVRRIAARLGADVLHANSVRAGLSAALARRSESLPLAVHVRDCLPGGLAGGAVRRLLGARADALIAISAYVAAGLAGQHVSAALRRKLHVVGNPVDLSRFRPAGEGEIDGARPPVLAIVGQITSWKGHDTVLKALPAVRQAFPDVRLKVVGEVKFAGSSTRLDNRAFLAEIHRLVDELDLGEAVELLGEREDVPEIMRSVAAVLVPSIEEPFGRTVAEAMAIGTPVIATAVGGPAELIEDGLTGTLAAPGEPAAWAQAILGVLQDRERAHRMAQRAAVQARSRFDAHAHAAAMQELYAALAASQPR